MVKEGDKIAVCISGGKDSMLLAKCMQELKKHRQVNFEFVFLVMDPGYNPINRQKIMSNAKLLNIPITMFESNIFEVVETILMGMLYGAQMQTMMPKLHSTYHEGIKIECGKITLNENKSFRDIDEIMKQMNIGGDKK